MKFGLVDNVSVGVRKGMARGRVWLKGLGRGQRRGMSDLTS